VADRIAAGALLAVFSNWTRALGRIPTVGMHLPN